MLYVCDTHVIAAMQVYLLYEHVHHTYSYALPHVILVASFQKTGKACELQVSVMHQRSSWWVLGHCLDIRCAGSVFEMAAGCHLPAKTTF